MDDETAQALLARLDALERDMVRYRQGTVTATSPLSVALGGSDVSYSDVSSLSSYSPATNDVAAAITFGNDLLVLGSIGGAGGIPAGTGAIWFTASAPTGWLLCDGSSFSGATYPELASVLGGTTLPNLSGKFPLGKSGSHALASTGGAETVTLTTNEMPAHTHGGSTGTSIQSLNHSHSVNGNGNGVVRTGFGGTAAGIQVGGSSYVYDNFLTSASDLTSHTHSISSQGGGAAHENMPPYVTVNFIIKT